MLGHRTILATHAVLPEGTAAAWSTMRYLGSPFAQMLAGAWQLGSLDQRERLEVAFPELVAQYAQIAPEALIDVRL